MKTKFFTLNEHNKVEFTKSELKKLLDEIYNDGYRDGRNSKGWWYYTTPYYTTTPYYSTSTSNLKTPNNAVNYSTATCTGSCKNNSTESNKKGYTIKWVKE